MQAARSLCEKEDIRFFKKTWFEQIPPNSEKTKGRRGNTGTRQHEGKYLSNLKFRGDERQKDKEKSGSGCVSRQASASPREEPKASSGFIDRLQIASGGPGDSH